MGDIFRNPITIVGNHKIEETKTIYLDEQNFSYTDEAYISPVYGNVFNQVILKKPENLTPENLQDGVTIMGVTGGDGGNGEPPPPHIDGPLIKIVDFDGTVIMSFKTQHMIVEEWIMWNPDLQEKLNQKIIQLEEKYSILNTLNATPPLRFIGFTDYMTEPLPMMQNGIEYDIGLKWEMIAEAEAEAILFFENHMPIEWRGEQVYFVVRSDDGGPLAPFSFITSDNPFEEHHINDAQDEYIYHGQLPETFPEYGWIKFKGTIQDMSQLTIIITPQHYGNINAYEIARYTKSMSIGPKDFVEPNPWDPPGEQQYFRKVILSQGLLIECRNLQYYIHTSSEQSDMIISNCSELKGIIVPNDLNLRIYTGDSFLDKEMAFVYKIYLPFDDFSVTDRFYMTFPRGASNVHFLLYAYDVQMGLDDLVMTLLSLRGLSPEAQYRNNKITIFK